MRLPKLLGVALVALVVRGLASWMLGPEPFGPDAPGVQAAVTLGGHPYPLHPTLVWLVGSARLTSVLGGLVAAMACGWIGTRLDPRPGALLGPGLLAACAPLFVLPSALDGGDAPALGLAAVGLALAFSGRTFLGALLAGLALAVKPVVAPALIPLVLVPAVVPGWRPAVGLILGATASAIGTLGTLDPLLRPRASSGILGSWFMATNGALPTVDALPTLALAGFRRLWDLPVWTGHPILGGLALIGAALPGPQRRTRVALALLAAGTLLTVSTLVGDGLNPRWLTGASLPLVVLAGLALRRAPVLALLFAWPALALIDALADTRAQLDPGTAHPVGIPWPLDRDATQQFDSSSICGASQLRALHEDLLDHPGPITVQPLPDGREGELVWPLQAARPDLVIRVTPDDPMVFEEAPCRYAIR